VSFQGFGPCLMTSRCCRTPIRRVRAQGDRCPSRRGVPGDARADPRRPTLPRCKKEGARRPGSGACRRRSNSAAADLSTFESIVVTEQMAKQPLLQLPGTGRRRVSASSRPVSLYPGQPAADRPVRATDHRATPGRSILRDQAKPHLAGQTRPGRSAPPPPPATCDVYRINGHKMWTTGADSARVRHRLRPH